MIEAALKDGPLSMIPHAQRELLLKGARTRKLRRGEWLAHNDQLPELVLVLDGMLRCSMVGAGERRITLRYVERGQIFGMLAIVCKMRDIRPTTWLTAASGLRYECHAVHDSHLLVLRPEPFQKLVHDDAHVASMMVCYLVETLHDAQRSHASDVILPLRARLARHLLSLAEVENGKLVVRVTNQYLADATGSVRDVTARLIRDFVTARWVARRGRALVLLQPAVLHDVAAGRDGVGVDGASIA